MLHVLKFELAFTTENFDQRMIHSGTNFFCILSRENAKGIYTCNLVLSFFFTGIHFSGAETCQANIFEVSNFRRIGINEVRIDILPFHYSKTQ